MSAEEDTTELIDVVKEESVSHSRPKRVVKKNDSPKEEKALRTGQRWSEEEKERLLKALHDYGHQDCKRIAQFVGTRSKHDVRVAIKYWKAQGMKVNLLNIHNSKKRQLELWRQQVVESRPNISHQNVKTLNTIEMWIDMLKKQLDKKGTDGIYGLASIMKIIAQFEALPTVEEADGIDFKQLYLWLGEMINGQPMRSLSGPTTAFLCDSMKHLAAHGTDHLLKQKSAIERIIGKAWVPVHVKSYSRKPAKKNNELEESVERILKMSGLNPLGFDLECVRIQEIQDSYK